MLVRAPRHQSAGDCSDHSGRGLDRGYSVVAPAITLPRSSINNALAPVVEISMPNK